MKHAKKITIALMLVAAIAGAVLVTDTKSILDASSSTYATNTTGTASLTLSKGKRMEVTEVRVKLSAVGGATENLTVTLDSGLGAEFDSVREGTTDMAAAANVVIKFDPPIQLATDDALVVAYANSNNRTWSIQALWDLK